MFWWSQGWLEWSLCPSESWAQVLSAFSQPQQHTEGGCNTTAQTLWSSLYWILPAHPQHWNQLHTHLCHPQGPFGHSNLPKKCTVIGLPTFLLFYLKNKTKTVNLKWLVFNSTCDHNPCSRSSLASRRHHRAMAQEHDTALLSWRKFIMQKFSSYSRQNSRLA